MSLSVQIIQTCKMKIKKLLSFLAKPVFHEIVFFGAFMILILPMVIYFLLSTIHFNHLEVVWYFAKDISLAVLYSYIATCLVYFTKSRLLKFVFYFIAVFLLAVNTYLKLIFGMIMSPMIVILVGETNAKESSEFFFFFLTTKEACYIYLVIIILAILLYISEKKLKKPLQGLMKRMPWGRFILLLFLLLGCWQTERIISLFQCSSFSQLEGWSQDNYSYRMDFISRLLYSFQAPAAARNENDQALKVNQNAFKSIEVKACNEKPLTLVFVLGESFIKHHSNLYGYEHETNPLMTAEVNNGNMFVFTDVISPDNHTTLAMKNLFCCNSLSDGEQWYEKPFFPLLFKKAGYDVFSFDIQRDFQVDAEFTFSVNSFIFNKEIARLSYTEVGEKHHEYDEQLVDDFIKNSHYNSSKNSLVMLHLLGQHFNTSSRFPHTPKFIYFSADSISRTDSFLTPKMKADIADYDNATRYNDYVIGKVIDFLRDKNAVLVYFSDHGEEVFDYRPSKSRVSGDNVNKILEYQYEIPFFIWFSNTYKEEHQKILEEVSEAVNRPFMIDNVCHIFFHLADLQTSVYVKERDVTSSEFKPRKRETIGGVDYDKIMRKTNLLPHK